MKGLTSAEVEQRVRDGLVNDSEVKTSRTYTDIIVKNALTPFNVVLFIIGALLLVFNEPISAVSATGIIIVNILISTVQEMRAKRRLDKIALLTRPKVTVVRDGKEVEIDQNAIVKDDVIVLRSGDQALVDGVVDECRSLEMDEALLTGESSTVRKSNGDTIYSGSICVTGEGYYTVTAFGEDSYASKMLSSAKRFTSKRTPLQMETGTITKVLMVTASIMLVITIATSLIRHSNLSAGTTLESFVLCLDVVPIALFLLITLTYMIAAVRMADSGVLLQRSNSVESISHVDTVCMDKTGTITTNKLVFERAEYFVDEADARRWCSVFATATGSKNRTIETILAEYGETHTELIDEIQFSSKRKYSAVRVNDGGSKYTLYLGAWEALGPYADVDFDLASKVDCESRKGLRTVLIFHGNDSPLHTPEGEDLIHDGLDPICLISIRDEIRPDCRETIQVFLDNGMDLKVISGDSPVTVDSLFTIANIPGERKIISGPELDALPKDERERAILETNIFGRMKPENKEEVIDVLKRNGRYVAMIGDGVNDVKSLKTAQVGVALESGSNAARGVSDMILVKDNFAALPKALVEGRRTVSGMRDILKLYLTRNFALAIMYVVIFLFLGTLPMIPIQNTFYAFVSVSIIAFFMTLFAKPDENKELILPDVLRFCIPSAIIIATFGLIVYAATWILYDTGFFTGVLESNAQIMDWSVDRLVSYLSWNGSEPHEIVARSAMVFFVTVAGVCQLLLICPRWRFLSTDGRTNRSLLPIGLVVFLFLILIAMYTCIPSLAIGLVNLVIFQWQYFVVLVCVVVVWFFIELMLLRKGALRRATDKVEEVYMQKLQEEYTKGDVQED